MKPKVSVFLSAYNHGPYIRAALDSVFAQERNFPIEVVVRDGGSTDNTREIVEEFADRYPDRMRLLYRERDGETGSLEESVLRGFEACRGEYIAAMDADDVWTDTSKLQRQADSLDARPVYWMCFHNCLVEYEGAYRKSWPLVDSALKESVTTDDFLQAALVQTSTIMMRRGVVGLLRKWPQFLNDWFIGIIASQLGPVWYIDRVMSVYRQSSAGGWSTRSRADQWALSVARCMTVRDVLGPEYRERINQAICTRAYMAAIEYERQGKYAKAEEYLSLALKAKPVWLEPYCARYGVTGDALMRRLANRTRMYRLPLVLPLWFLLERWSAELRWRWLQAATKVRSQLRLQRGLAVGYLYASPNPVRCSARGSGLSSVDLEWTLEGTEAVEVRVGRPDGALLSHTALSGKTKTGDWVADGMLFFLQDVLGGLPLTSENTLDVVRVRVEGY